MSKKITNYKLVMCFFYSQISIYLVIYILKLENQGNENFFKIDFFLVILIFFLAARLISEVIYNFEKKIVFFSYYFLFINNVCMLNYLKNSEIKDIMNIDSFILIVLIVFLIAAVFEWNNSVIRSFDEFNFSLFMHRFFRAILGLMIIAFFIAMIIKYFEIIKLFIVMIQEVFIKEEFISTCLTIISFLMYVIIVSISIVFLIYNIYIYIFRKNIFRDRGQNRN